MAEIGVLVKDVVKVDGVGRILIPRSIRVKMGLKAGQELKVSLVVEVSESSTYRIIVDL